MKKILKTVTKYIGTYIFLIAIFLILLILTSLIPRENIYVHTKESAEKLLELNEKTVIKTILKSEVLFNYTDAIMLNTAYSIDTSNPFESAMLARRNYLSSERTPNVYKDNSQPGLIEEGRASYDEGEVQTQELYNVVNGEEQKSYEYARYWHGYLTLLRPALIVMNYQTMQSVSFVLLLILLGILLILIYKKFGLIASMIFLVGFFSIELPLIAISINAIGVFYIAILYSIYILLKFNKIKNIGLQFFVIGSITCFIDLLTTPLVTFGIPAIIYFMCLQREYNCTFRELILKYFKIGISWILGMGLTWIAKWIIVDVLYDKGIVENAMKQVLFRVGMDNYKVSVKDVFEYIFSAFNMRTFLIAVASALLIAIPSIIKKGLYGEEIIGGYRAMPYVITAIIPILWLCIISSHSYMHYFFVNRILVIFIIAFGIAITTGFGIIPLEKYEDYEERKK